MHRPVLSVTNPDSPRGKHFAAAARERGLALEVVSWASLLERGGILERSEPAVVRLDSLGRHAGVAAQLAKIGGASTYTCAFGELHAPAHKVAGLATAFAALEDSLARQPHLTPLVRPAVLASMFDKRGVHRRLDELGLPHPDNIEPPDRVEELYDMLRQRGWSRAYVKLNSGSCATGIVLLDLERRRGSTTVLAKGARMFNTRRLRSIEGPRLDRVLGFLLREGACVERAVALAELDGDPFDMRAIVIDGEVAFTIFRTSPHPITNLHLGGRRADPQRCRAMLPDRLWGEAMQDCVAAARGFDAAVVGIDVLFDRERMSHYLLELNAFGDFFPAWEQRGRTVHGAVLDAIARRLRYRPSTVGGPSKDSRKNS